MPKNPSIYTNELEKFKNEYNLKEYDLTKLITTDAAIRFLNGNGGDNAAQQYAELAAATMATVFEAKTSVSENSAPDISGFKLKKFLADFENLVDAKYRSELENEADNKRNPLSGANLEDVKNACQERAKGFNKTLPTMWKEGIRSGSIKIDDMQRITTECFRRMTPADYDSVDKSQMKNELTNVVAAFEAMKQVRETRKGFFGFFWKLFNGEQNTKEENYLSSLKSHIALLEVRKYDIEGVTYELESKTVLGKEVPGVRKPRRYMYEDTEMENENDISDVSVSDEARARIDTNKLETDVNDNNVNELSELVDTKSSPVKESIIE